MMKLSNGFKAALATLVAAAVVFAGFAYVESSRLIALTVYGAAFATCAYFVAIFRTRVRDAALVGASLALGLFVIEIVTWKLGGAPTTYKEKGSWAERPELGWSPARPGPIHERKVAADGGVIYDVVNTIDEHLTRKVDSSKNGPTVAFFGDSVTFGAGVDDSETLPQAFADLTGRKYHVLNLAVTAYGPQQFLRALEIDAHDARLRQDPRLFIMLTAPWHAPRTACKAANAWLGPSYALENGAPVYKGPCSSRAPGVAGALRGLFRATEAYKFFFGSREEPVDEADIDLYVAILVKAGELARQKYGVPTLILYLKDDLASPRYRLGPGYANEDIMRRLRAGGLTVLDVWLDANAYPGRALLIPGDGHPTGFAHRLWAEKVKEFVAAEIGRPAAR